MILLAHSILTMQHRFPLIHDGAIVLRQGEITALGPAQKILKQYPRDRVIDLGNAVLMPGLINAHTHLELPPLLDEIRAKSFPEWVMNLIRAKRGLKETDYTSAAHANVNALIRCGTTTAAEISTHGVSPKILKQSGLRSIVFHEVIDMSPVSSLLQPNSPFLARMKHILRHKAADTALITTGISPHAPHTVSESALLSILDIAVDRSLPLCMHVAESRDELQFLEQKKSGFDKLYELVRWNRDDAPSADSPFRYLEKTGSTAGFIAVHAVQADDRDIGIISKAKMSVVHCPRSNNETGAGRMKLSQFLRAGIPLGLGTDSLASTPSLNLWDEMRYACRIHKKDGVMPKDILYMATRGGAEALGLSSVIGTLEPGKRADIIALPLPSSFTDDLSYDLIMKTEYCIMAVVDGKILTV